jgi:hypothetical protein
MKKYPAVYNRMVAAYIIGYPVTTEYLANNKHLKFAEGADDTKVIISYNTEYYGFDGINPVMQANAIAINPINWKRDTTLATAATNLGSLALDPNKIPKPEVFDIPGLADAEVEPVRGVVKCSVTPDMVSKSATFPVGVYHVYDYPFYFNNIKDNARVRVNVFLNK